MAGNEQRETIAFIGTYTQFPAQARGRAEGIYGARLDPHSGALSIVGCTPGLENPSFLAVDAERRYLYVVSEVAEFAGREGGGVAALAIGEKGALVPLNQQPTHASDPCYVSVDRSGRWVLVANYTGGSVAVLPVGEDGRLGAAATVVQHQGSSVNRSRQEGPHPHSVILDPSGRHALVADLGLDRIFVYRLDGQTGALTLNGAPRPVAPGSGPRHLELHPSGRYLYATNELSSTVTAFAYEAEQGSLRELQTVPTLPAEWTGESTAADLHVARSGRFLYASNRGHDSIAIFSVDGDTGMLRALGHASTQGRTPRNFAIDPSGRFLLVANQDSHTVVTLRIDAQSGLLAPTGQVAEVPSPVCVRVVAFG